MLGLLAQCGTKDVTRSFNTDQVNQLLSAGEAKTWTLTARTEDGEDVFGACLEDNTLTFVEATVDSVYVLGRPASCSGTSTIDTLYKAKYTIVGNVKEVFQDSISFTEEAHQTIGVMQVEELTSSNLKINYTADGKAIQERYTY